MTSPSQQGGLGFSDQESALSLITGLILFHKFGVMPENKLSVYAPLN
ncbi:protein of unknown function [Shewanella benthica]|uniref:Uncharacterized protein n=2 Tax=Shewanella benthica TaxID=43661 RepID=A0A330M503_9GAMM|nr:protein of unknown function [Shewanella benthica]